VSTTELSAKVSALIEIINREASVFEEFLTLLGRQQEVLVKNDIDGLNRVTALQREKLVESQLLNKKREELISEIKSVNAIEGDLNVSRLVELVNEDQGNRLLQLRDIINGLNTQIIEVRNQNALLLNRSREYIARTMDLLSKINNPNTNYTHNGAPAKNAAAVALDRKV
jgi:hypothetical protein